MCWHPDRDSGLVLLKRGPPRAGPFSVSRRSRATASFADRRWCENLVEIHGAVVDGTFLRRSSEDLVATPENMNSVEISPPYLVFVGDTDDPLLAKTGFGVVHWRREQCLGQFRFDDTGVDLGLPDMTITEAARKGASSMIVGVANIGGYYPESWRQALVQAANEGLNIVAGMHTRLEGVPGLAEAASRIGIASRRRSSAAEQAPRRDRKETLGNAPPHGRDRLCRG